MLQLELSWRKGWGRSLASLSLRGRPTAWGMWELECCHGAWQAVGTWAKTCMVGEGTSWSRKRLEQVHVNFRRSGDGSRFTSNRLAWGVRVSCSRITIHGGRSRCWCSRAGLVKNSWSWRDPRVSWCLLCVQRLDRSGLHARGRGRA